MLERVVEKLADLECTPEHVDVLSGLLPPMPTDQNIEGRRESGRRWRTLLQEVPHSRILYDNRFGINAWQRNVDGLLRFRQEFPTKEPGFQECHQPLYGALNLLLAIYYALDESEARRRPLEESRRVPTASHDCARICVKLFDDPATQQAIRWIYYPEGNKAEMPRTLKGDDDGNPIREWDENIDFGTLRFLRHGTTSIILTGKANLGGSGDFALKLIIPPFLKLPQIARSTEEYWSTYGCLKSSSVVNVWASSPAWILMNRVPGVPLDEALERDLKRWDRLKVLYVYGRALFATLHDLETVWRDQQGNGDQVLAHQDLSPSNIMVTTVHDVPALILIDLGKNFLYSQAIVGLEGHEARFIAPEVRAGSGSVERADFYSLGHLLIAASGTEHNLDGTVPDDFYAYAPLIARFLEDLLDRDPERRLITLGTTKFDRLGERFEEEVEAVRSAGAGPFTDKHPRTLSSLAEFFRPFANNPQRLRKIYWTRRRQASSEGQRHDFHAKYFFLWSTLAASAFFLTMFIVTSWLLRDFGWDWGSPVIEFFTRLLGGTGSISDRLVKNDSPETVPFLDFLRQPSYSVPDWRRNLPARIVGVSYALVCAKYYANLFAGIAPLILGTRLGSLSIRAAGAAFFMRLSGLTAALFVLPFTLIQADWWPVCSALGQTTTFLCNWLAADFARAAIMRARRDGFTTVASDDAKVTGLGSFSQWTPSSFFYALIVWSIGTLVVLGILQDEYVYAAGVSSTNILLLYGVKCASGSVSVRIFLVRGMLAGERVRVFSELSAHPPADQQKLTKKHNKTFGLDLPESRQSRN
jgi:serine/threonine protein kinase